EILVAVVAARRDPIAEGSNEVATQALRAVVGHEEDQRVVELADRFEIRDEAPDLVVEIADHGRVNFHLARLDAPFLVAQLFPPRLTFDRRYAREIRRHEAE